MVRDFVGHLSGCEEQVKMMLRLLVSLHDPINTFLRELVSLQHERFVPFDVNLYEIDLLPLQGCVHGLRSHLDR